jgi:hypothetical protein
MTDANYSNYDNVVDALMHGMVNTVCNALFPQNPNGNIPWLNGG